MNLIKRVNVNRSTYYPWKQSF